ncbi:gustatory receptor for sugar taste 64a-like [Aricia agestis]|uniref:gustatory receptor for sugar taste 64a-like n=1 Tax=Aricia agestis TaxID=91739 RepID=UPI001C2046DB|nr:gustatory receptor for sugar taste 64a-like [Aricia agestis]
MSKVFRWSRVLGVVGGASIWWKLWGAFVVGWLVAIEVQAVWKVIKALSGLASDTTGNRSITVRFAGTIFYMGNLIGLILCWRLSSSWVTLAKYWTSLELGLSIKQVPKDNTIRYRMNTVIIVIAIGAVVEHLLNVMVNLETDCSFVECLRRFMLKSHGFLFLENQYKDWYTIPLLFMSNLATVVWNLQDLLVILISMGLSSRYTRLNACVKKVLEMTNEKNLTTNIKTLKLHTWRLIRTSFVQQATLVRRVNGDLGVLLLASTASNFYFICLQLFLGFAHGLSELLLNRIYYMMSFSWLCFRASLAILTAAGVNRLSNAVLPDLYQCPPEFYNVEIERLQKQLSEECVALNGLELFYIRRGILLQIAGTVFTYALVLIQYDTEQNTTNVPENVTTLA